MAKTVSLRNKTIRVLLAEKDAILKRLQIPRTLLRASLVRQYVTCDKRNCRCRRGLKHGPFFYLVQCLPGGKIRKFLLKTREYRARAREAIQVRAEFEKRLNELSHINTELLRRGDAVSATRS